MPWETECKKKVVKKNSRKKWIHLQKKKSLLIKKVFSLVSHMKKIIMCGTSEKKFLCGSQWNFFFLCGTERKSFFIGSTKMSLKNKNLWKHIHVKFSLFCCPDWKEGQKKKKTCEKPEKKKSTQGFHTSWFLTFITQFVVLFSFMWIHKCWNKMHWSPKCPSLYVV